MSYYTLFSFVGKLKDEYREDVENLLTDKAYSKMAEEDCDCLPSEIIWRKFAEKHQFCDNFIKDSNSIPFCGVSAYNRDKVMTKDSFSNVLFGTWTFLCDVNHGSNAIGIFIDEIAPKICKTFVAKVWDEDADMPIVYVYNGNITIETDLNTEE